MEAMTNLTNGTNTGTSVGSTTVVVNNNNAANNSSTGSNGSVAGSNVDSGSQNGSTGSGRSTPSSSDSSPGKLFVGGLSWQTTPEKLRDYFGQFGNVTDVLVMKDPVTQVNTLCCYCLTIKKLLSRLYYTNQFLSKITTSATL